MKQEGGGWKKERTTGRKYSQSDSHPAPKAHSRKRIWVSTFTRAGKRIDGYYRATPR